MTSANEPDDEFIAAATHALRTTPGPEALDELGWWDLLGDGIAPWGDPDAREAVFAVFRAQGRELADTAALGALVASTFLVAAGRGPGEAVAVLPRGASKGSGVDTWTLIGPVGRRPLLVDRAGSGVWLVDLAEVAVTAVELSGRFSLAEVSIPPDAGELILTEPRAAAVRDRARYLARLALATELHGLAERIVDLAVEYATVREQFSKPIGTFQAVRHLLSWASTDVTAIGSVNRRGMDFADSPPARFDEVVKALAGRNARQACQRSLQVFGGIGFTAEHPHHHYQSRVLMLDALLGSSAELTHGLGRWLREVNTDPGFTAAAAHLAAATSSGSR